MKDNFGPLVMSTVLLALFVILLYIGIKDQNNVAQRTSVKYEMDKCIKVVGDYKKCYQLAIDK